ncbi:hypothetical protein MKX03_007816 [Papaver bracteatum]|nr:hypothetical protein MKX03_007816 [Papaver bracteatum]
MVLFSSSTGDLTHRYEVKSREVGALCFNSDNKIFSSCTGGIGVWDQVTGKEIDFFSAPSDWPYGYADKIEWLNGNSCLLASVIGRSNDLRHISLLDFRDKSMVWSWNNRDYRIGDTWHHDEENRFYDVIAMEESNSVCVAGGLGGLGYIDLRSTIRSKIRWNLTNYNGNKKHEHYSIYHPKLTLHGGHVFYSSAGNISVFSGRDYSILTSRLTSNCGGSVRDFSIGGDRLFALHCEENVFNVWETPAPPII